MTILNKKIENKKQNEELKSVIEDYAYDFFKKIENKIEMNEWILTDDDFYKRFDEAAKEAGEDVIQHVKNNIDEYIEYYSREYFSIHFDTMNAYSAEIFDEEYGWVSFNDVIKKIESEYEGYVDFFNTKGAEDFFKNLDDYVADYLIESITYHDFNKEA